MAPKFDPSEVIEVCIIYAIAFFRCIDDFKVFFVEN